MARQTASKTKYFVGLDLSLTATGVVVLDKDGAVKERKVIKFPKLSDAPRLDAIQNEVRKIIGQYNVELVCIEGYATRASGKNFNIGELGGVVRLLLWRLKIPYIDPKPTQVKKFATGKGGGEGGSKDQVTMHVYKNWAFEAVDNNEADAFVLAQISRGLCSVGYWVKHQKEVINQILNPEKKSKGKKNGT